MEVSTLTYSGGIGLQARSPLLRLQSDERLISLTRRGSAAAFETLVSRYQSRLLAFCRHLLRSREDAEDVLQDVFAAAFNAMMADDRPIAARPWLYRIARNRCLNHLRRVQPISVDTMDVHFSEHGASTADKVHARESFRLLVNDIHGLPETQRSALVLREMDALSYEQIAEAMETTVPSVKSLLVRARISLAEAAEARQLGCPEVRQELAEVAEGFMRRPGPTVRRHLRTCGRCSAFERQLKRTNKALAAYLPVGSLALAHKLAFLHLGHSAGTGSGATATAGMSGATAGTGGTAGMGGATASAAGTAGISGATATAGATGVGATAGATGVGATAASAGTGLLTAGAGALATKAAAGLAAAALVTAGAIATTHHPRRPPARPAALSTSASTSAAGSSSGDESFEPSTSSLESTRQITAASEPVAAQPAVTSTASTTTAAASTSTTPIGTTTTPQTQTTSTTGSQTTTPPAGTASASGSGTTTGSGSATGSSGSVSTGSSGSVSTAPGDASDPGSSGSGSGDGSGSPTSGSGTGSTSGSGASDTGSSGSGSAGGTSFGGASSGGTSSGGGSGASSSGADTVTGTAGDPGSTPSS
jgi:RNA polymerase sigma factor (sigma-70 family)